MNLNKVLTFIGFARKMGKICYGQSVINEVRSNKTKVVFIDEIASENTVDKYTSACNAHDVKCGMVPPNSLGNAIGKPNVRVVCIKNSEIGETILENLD